MRHVSLGGHDDDGGGICHRRVVPKRSVYLTGKLFPHMSPNLIYIYLVAISPFGTSPWVRHRTNNKKKLRKDRPGQTLFGGSSIQYSG